MGLLAWTLIGLTISCVVGLVSRMVTAQEGSKG
jgi:hypothetical protein